MLLDDGVKYLIAMGSQAAILKIFRPARQHVSQLAYAPAILTAIDVIAPYILGCSQLHTARIAGKGWQFSETDTF